ncbi:MAG: prepilin peptidase [Candidatus Eisenbacteria bacterium]|uniref:Prepilin leader peptidase/N-methyltransferase n=1 Tax=Eiseniibacteriota bacterium TaxID=2212470 RepID=A0A538TA18_UNCEI|nr:MAG: prepilin peptidase [Candidatus Eisenbacteria bacterium]
MEAGRWIQASAFATGLVLGSFLNVVIARLPRGESIVNPASRCPRCKKGILPWDNVPVLSFVFLGGRCRHCRRPISWRYPAVELLSGLLLWLLVQRVETPLLLVPQAAFLLALLAIAWIDLDTQTIPDVVTIPGVGLGLAASLFAPPGLAGALLGAVCGGASLWLVGALYERSTGVPGMGGGDVKLAAMMGAFLGVGGVFGAIFLASLAGSVFGILLIARGKGSRRTAIPFGTFLAPAAIALCLYGDSLFRLYRSFLP